MGRRTVAEGIVHSGELGAHIVFAQAHQLEGLHHDLRIVVPNGAGGQPTRCRPGRTIGQDGPGGGSPRARLSAAHPCRRKASRRGCGRIPARRIPPRSHTGGNPQSSRTHTVPDLKWPSHWASASILRITPEVFRAWLQVPAAQKHQGVVCQAPAHESTRSAGPGRR